MYLEHFGLSEPPFRITPHTDFFFDGANRGATLDALIYAITHDEGIVKVSGEVGSGKTMLCRVLMERLPEHVTIIYLANPSLSRDDILFAISDELGLVVPDNARPAIVMRILHDHLIKAYSEKRQVVVLIDEAHAMPAETLEEIRLLSNLESNHSKLLQLVLFGQPELNVVLARPDMRQLKERITHNFSLEPLIRDDIAHYLDFRMRAAGYKGPSVFTPQAVKSIAKVSLGLTRRINILADKALLAAFSEASHQIGPKQIQAAIRDCDFSEAPFADKTGMKLSVPVQIFTVLGLIVIAIVAFYSPSPQQPASASLPTPSGIATEVAMPANTPQAQTETSPKPNSTGPAENSATKDIIPATPPTSTSEPLRSTEQPRGDLTPSSRQGQKTRAAVQAGQEWLAHTSDQRWFVQLYAVNIDDAADIEHYLNQAALRKAGPQDLRAYVSDLSGRTRIGVIYGDFATSAEASASIRALPSVMKNTKPYPRQAIKLR